MKIALIGSAPSSIRLAPFDDASWQIYACSPGAYAVLPRCNKFFELHRWEPGVIGKPQTQVPWFSPEYVMWMAQQSCVVMVEPVPQLPNSVRLPREELVSKYGSYFFTSSLSWMFAMALEEIEKAHTAGDHGPHAIGLWGVDMSASEEWGYQRAGCQFFAQLAQQKGIQVQVPPESDLLCPAPMYGVCEHSHMHIKMTARRRELEGRLQAAESRRIQAEQESYFLKGAIDDLNYVCGTWLHDVSTAHVTDLQRLFGSPPPEADSAEMVFAEPLSNTAKRAIHGSLLHETEEHAAALSRQYVVKGNGQDHEESLHL